jgi:hypothetical protein
MERFGAVSKEAKAQADKQKKADDVSYLTFFSV